MDPGSELRREPTAPPPAYVARALAEECAKVAQAPPHQANATLHSAAVALGTMSGAGWLARGEAEDALMRAAAQRGKDANEARATIKSGLDWGADHPRGLENLVQPRQAKPLSAAVDDSGQGKRALALKIWNSAADTTGTLADIYLEARGLEPGSRFELRFASDVPMPEAGRHPCLLAAVVEPMSRAFLGIQRTALSDDGSTKANVFMPKASLGRTAGGAVVLGDLGGHDTIIEGEGLETVLSVVDVTGFPGIATLSAGTLGKPALPTGKSVILLVDRGNEADAERGAARRHAEGRVVRLAHVPANIEPGTRGADFNDLLRSHGHDGVKAAIEAAAIWEPAVDPAPIVDDDDPLPLVRQLGAPEPFPIDALGDLTGSAVAGLVDITQAPVALCASSVLAAAALGTQAHADVVLPIGAGQRRPLSLYFGSVAVSGERKTTVDREVLAAVRGREAELREIHASEYVAHEARLDAWQKERKSILANKELGQLATEADLKALGPTPEAPLVPYLTCEEPTAEGLVKLLAAGQPSIGIFSAEGGQFVGGHAMREEARLHTAATLSDLWDGSTVKRIRAGDAPLMLSGRRMSLHLMMQPDVSARLLADRTLLDQGLLSRILPSAPESTIGTRLFRVPSSVSIEQAQRFAGRLAELLRRPATIAPGTRNQLEPRGLTLDPIAREIWIKFADAIEQQQAPGKELSGLTGFASKLAEQAARLAGVLTVFDTPDAMTIDAGHMASGIEIAQWFAGEALRLLGAAAGDDDIRDAQVLLDWITSRWSEPAISVPDIVNSGPNRFRTTKRITELVKVLRRHGWLVPLPGGAEIKGRRRKETFRVVRRRS